MAIFLTFVIITVCIYCCAPSFGIVLDKQDEEFFKISDKAIEYSKNEQYDLAIQAYEEALKINPKQIQAMGELCYCYNLKEQYDKVKEIAYKALEIAQKRVNIDNIGRFYSILGNAYKAENNFKEAVKYLNLAIVNKPHYMPNYLSIAYCYYKLDDLDTAIEYYKEISERDADYAKEIDAEESIEELRYYEECKFQDIKHSRLGFKYLQENKKDLAKAEFENALAINENNIIALYGKVEYYVEEKRWRDAIRLGKKLFELINTKENKSWNFLYDVVSLQLEQSYRNLEDFDNSTYYARLYSQSQSIKEANKLINEFKFKEAINVYKEALKYEERKCDIFMGIIRLSFLEENYKQAMEYANQGIASFQKINKIIDYDILAKFYWYKAKCYADNGELEQGLKYCELALNTSKDISEKLTHCFNLSQIYNRMDNPVKTLEYYKKCQEYIDTGVKDTYDIPSLIVKLQVTYDENSDLKKSEKHYNYGISFFKDFKIEEAISEFKLALKLIPQDIETLDMLARCYYTLKNLDLTYQFAYEGYTVSLKDRNYSHLEMFCYNIANCYYNSGDNEHALEFYKKAHEQNPNDVDNLYFIGACHRNLGNYDKAIEYFEKALKINPKDNDIVLQLEYCKSKLNTK